MMKLQVIHLYCMLCESSVNEVVEVVKLDVMSSASSVWRWRHESSATSSFVTSQRCVGHSSTGNRLSAGGRAASTSRLCRSVLMSHLVISHFFVRCFRSFHAVLTSTELDVVFRLVGNFTMTGDRPLQIFKVSEEVNGKCPARNTTVELATLHRPRVSQQTALQRDWQTDDSIMPTACTAVRSAKKISVNIC